jgi:transaldolase
MMSPVKHLIDFGQSPWLDFIERDLLVTGELTRLIDEWGLRGMTSNPAIFEKAIADTRQYDADIARLARDGLRAQQVYEALAIDDVRKAADLFRPVYDATAAFDGYVSLEVSPHLALDTEATIVEARRLWSTLDRPNVMIKVPGTPPGLDAIRQLIGEGINVNVTLLFSVPRYAEVARAYAAGLAIAQRVGRPLERIASVASFSS